MTRIKTNTFGIWSNTDHVSFEHFPSFYAVVSSGRLDNIIDPAVMNEYTILPLDQARAAAQSTGLKGERFGQELVRLMGRPQQQRHSLQIELNRALYMDEATREPNAGFDRLQAALGRIVDAVAHEVRARCAAGT